MPSTNRMPKIDDAIRWVDMLLVRPRMDARRRHEPGHRLGATDEYQSGELDGNPQRSGNIERTGNHEACAEKQADCPEDDKKKTERLAEFLVPEVGVRFGGGALRGPAPICR